MYKYLEYLRINKLWKNYGRGSNRTILVVDSGYDPDSGIADVASFPNIIPDGIEQDIDISGHGTKVVDIIHSIAPRANIFSIRATTNKPRVNSYWYREALEYIIHQPIKFDFINCSWALQEDYPRLHYAIQKLKENGATILAGVGNFSGRIFYPASYPEVVSIGGLWFKDESEYPNNAEGWDLIVPGMGIKTKSGKVMGTSFACACATGLMGLGMSVDNIKKHIVKIKPMEKRRKK